MARQVIFIVLTIVLLITPVSIFGTIFSMPQSIGASISQPSGANVSSVTVPLTIPPAVSQATPLGAVNGSTQVSLGIVLPPNNQLGLQQQITEISNPLSPKYRDFISSQQYTELYGPNIAEANLLSTYFRSNGLSTSFARSNPDLLLVTGNALSAERALQVSIQSFELNGMHFYSATSSPRLPGEFSNIHNIFGLTNYGSNLGINVTATPTYKLLGALNGKPLQTDSNYIYYSPSEIKQAYNVTSLMNEGYSGSGVTIAIVDAFGDPYIQKEVDNFSTEFNLPQVNVNQICVDGPCNYAEGISQGWNTEIALDVEWAHAMAPQAAIDLYIGSNSSVPLYNAVQQAVSDGNNSIISLSWGSPENSIASSATIAPVFGVNYPWLDQVLQQAAAEGITVFASAGDWGAYDQTMGETSPYGGAIYPSTDPYVTSVGGTSLYMNFTSGFESPYFNATGSHGVETAWSWNNVLSSATGGGYSTLFGAPSWQRGQGFSGSTRGAPDVSWDAEPQTGVLVSLYNPSSQNYTYYIVGGTSVGAPSWAGSLALLDQKAGGKLGLINPTLYSLLSNQTEYSKAFHDITTGNNNPYSATLGWDPLTGLGSPNLGELANFIAPTGSLAVSVTNSLSGDLGASYSFGSQIGISANVTGPTGLVSNGTVSAQIVGPGGQTIATGVPLTFNSLTQGWTGSYNVKATDPPGMWTMTISASSGSSSGFGYTTFSVGDGITIFQPYYNLTTNVASTVYVQVGHKIEVSASINEPSGKCCVTSGNFTASFFLNRPSGGLEGNAVLSYNSSSNFWEGSFLIPKNADQGAWVLQVNGTDSSGNSGIAYSWMNVGLYMLMVTDSSTYVLGDTIGILFAPLYSNGTIAISGSFTASVSDGTSLITTVPLKFNLLDGFWVGFLNLTASDPVGFYTITISGNDGLGNSGSFAMVTRVAQYNLTGQLVLPSKEISINGGSIPTVSARISYPNGTLMTLGSVEAYVSLDRSGLLVPINHIRLTYQTSSQSFVGVNVLKAANVLTTSLGNYVVNIQAFDPYGNFANLTTTFFVNGIGHGPISIANNAQFNTLNGVIGGTGTMSNPYLIAGWNTTSISITNNVSASYKLYNNWVEGSVGDGIYLNTPNSFGSVIEGDYSISNAGNGIVVNGGQQISIASVAASGNKLNGIVISGLPDGIASSFSGSVANSNNLNGIVVENTSYFSVASSLASKNKNSGFQIYNSPNSSLIYDSATRNAVGVNVSGLRGYSYGLVQILLSNFLNNNVGIQVDGMEQTVTDTSPHVSSVLAADNIEGYNNIALLGSNNSVLAFESNLVGLNNHGIILDYSLPLVLNNIIANNNATAVDITGPSPGTGHCEVQFANSSKSLFSSCIALNVLSQNGVQGSSAADGLMISNINGSFVYANVAEKNSGDGISAINSTEALASSNLASSNSGAGMTFSNTTASRISANILDKNLNGLVVNKGSGSTIDQNNVSANTINGIILSQGKDDSIVNNTATGNTGGCTSDSGCTIAGGIELRNSSNNTVTHNQVSRNTGSGSLGAGIYISESSSQNSILSNNATGNNAGVALNTSTDNNISNNTIAANTYGIYLVSSPGNSLSSNTFSGNIQEVYPSQPTVSFSNLANGKRIMGQFKILWNSTGQEITNETMLIDGKSITVDGNGYLWNSSSLPDGNHTVTVQVTNAGGLSTSASVVVSTYNHETIRVDTVGPDKIPIGGSLVNLLNSTFSLNQTTDSSGHAIFGGLVPGVYKVSTSINGTVLSSTVKFDLNTSVVLYSPTLITTSYATLSSGGSVPIELSGSIISSQLQNVILNDSMGVYSLSFTLTDQTGTQGEATVTIPKSFVPGGLVPKIMLDGVATNQSFTQDKNNYYINVSSQLGSHNFDIQFNRVISFNLRYVVVSVAILAMIAGGIIYTVRRRGNVRL